MVVLGLALYEQREPAILANTILNDTHAIWMKFRWLLEALEANIVRQTLRQCDFIWPDPMSAAIWTISLRQEG